jgi:hypothetical protein
LASSCKRISPMRASKIESLKATLQINMHRCGCDLCVCLSCKLCRTAAFFAPHAVQCVAPGCTATLWLLQATSSCCSGASCQAPGCLLRHRGCALTASGEKLCTGREGRQYCCCMLRTPCKKVSCSCSGCCLLKQALQESAAVRCFSRTCRTTCCSRLGCYKLRQTLQETVHCSLNAREAPASRYSVSYAHD